MKIIIVTIPDDYDIDHVMSQIERGTCYANNIIIEGK